MVAGSAVWATQHDPRAAAQQTAVDQEFSGVAASTELTAAVSSKASIDKPTIEQLQATLQDLRHRTRRITRQSTSAAKSVAGASSTAGNVPQPSPVNPPATDTATGASGG